MTNLKQRLKKCFQPDIIKYFPATVQLVKFVTESDDFNLRNLHYMIWHFND